MSESGRYTDDDGSDEKEITSVYAAGEEDINAAVKAAKNALKADSWKLLPPTERGNLMLKFADLVDQHKETLATIETWDNGNFPDTDTRTRTDQIRQALPGFPQR